MSQKWSHLVRFLAEEDNQIHLGNVDVSIYTDIGLDLYSGKQVRVRLVAGSVFDGTVTDKIMTVKQLLPPLASHEVPLIRCLGLNYHDHAIEAKMPVPNEPVLFIKPRTAVSGPWPAAINIPKTAQDGSSDYEAELAFVISKDCRDVCEEQALDFVLGYTCSNDVTARNHQFRNSQWCFGKGFDGFAPIGPVLVSPSALVDPHRLKIQAILNEAVVQESNTSELIFRIPKIVSFLSQGTTLERGTIIMTGTTSGIGIFRDPPLTLNHGDDMRVYIEKIGTLINKVYHE